MKKILVSVLFCSTLFVQAGPVSAALPPSLCGRIFMTVGSKGEEGIRLESIKPSGRARRLFDGFSRSTNDAVPSPNGKLVVVSVYDGEENGADLFLVRADGTGKRRLTSGPGYDWLPSWSPDSRRLVFQRGIWTESSPAEVLVLDLRTGSETVIAQGGDPAWSPDGDLIAYAAQSESLGDLTRDLMVTDPRGKGVRALTEDPASHDSGPEWSPDGQQVAFTRTPLAQENQNEGPYADIWRVERSGETESQVTRQQDDLNGVHDPRWSPDGRKIAYVFSNDGGSWVQTIHADGTRHRRATKGFSAYWFDPSWSPNGRRIAYVKYSSGGSDVWRARPNGDNATAVTQSPNLFEGSAEWIHCN